MCVCGWVMYVWCCLLLLHVFVFVHCLFVFGVMSLLLFVVACCQRSMFALRLCLICVVLFCFVFSCFVYLWLCVECSVCLCFSV